MIIENQFDIVRFVLALIVGITLYINLNNIGKIYGISKKIVNIILILFFLVTLVSYFGFSIILNLFFVIIILWCIFFTFIVDRKYSYGFSIIFIFLSVFILLLGYSKLAEYFSLIGFGILVIAVLKDIFYGKLSEK